MLIRDDLEQLIPQLCVLSLSELEAGKAVTVSLFTDAASVKLTPVGDQLQIEVPDERRESYPRDTALAALEACGARYVRLIELNFPDDASRQMKLAPVQLELLRREDARPEVALPMENPELPNEPDPEP